VLLATVRLLAHAIALSCIGFAGWGAGVAGAQSACADLGGTVDAGQMCHVLTAEPTYRYEFTFPVDYPDQQAVTDYLTHERDDFVGYVTTLTRPRDIPYELDIGANSYQSGSPPAGTESLVLKVFSETGGAHPVTFFKAFNYDRGKGAPVTFDTLFKPGTAPLDVIYPVVSSTLTARFGPEEQMYGGHDVKTYENFAITDDAVTFFFGQGQVLAQVDGPISVAVPRSDLAAILA
jgi:Protein of unknown function (DUF3298)